MHRSKVYALFHVFVRYTVDGPAPGGFSVYGFVGDSNGTANCDATNERYGQVSDANCGGIYAHG